MKSRGDPDGHAKTAHEALIYLMVITSASDRDMTDLELARIGEVVRTWPVFEDFDAEKLVSTAQKCEKLLHEEAGLDGVLRLANAAIPERLRDTAYAAAYEVAAVDLEMRLEEARRAATGCATISPWKTRRRLRHRARRQGAPPHADLRRSRPSRLPAQSRS